MPKKLSQDEISAVYAKIAELTLQASKDLISNNPAHLA
jgi:hypothetical protein